MSEAVNTDDPRLDELHRIMAEKLPGRALAAAPAHAGTETAPVALAGDLLLPDGVRRGREAGAHRRGRQAPHRATREPRPHRLQVHHPHHPDVHPAREARRAGRVPPPHRRGPALRGRRRRHRLHHGGRRGNAHGAGRPGADAELDLARPLQPGREQHRVAGRPRRAPHEPARRQLPRKLRRGTRPARHQVRRLQPPPPRRRAPPHREPRQPRPALHLQVERHPAGPGATGGIRRRRSP